MRHVRTITGIRSMALLGLADLEERETEEGRTRRLARATLVLMGGETNPLREVVRKMRSDNIQPLQDTPLGPAYLVRPGGGLSRDVLEAACSASDARANPFATDSYFVRADL